MHGELGGERDTHEAQPLCRRCSKQTELLTVLHRTTEHPTFRIYGCGSCGFVDWVADKINP